MVRVPHRPRGKAVSSVCLRPDSHPAGPQLRRGPPVYTRKAFPRRYYVDGSGDVYRKHLADLVVAANSASRGAVIRRLSRIYGTVLIDELQDLAGWDLEFLDLLLDAEVNLLMVGDPRQHTFATYPSNKNKKYRGMGIVDWLDERDGRCNRIDRTESYRCHQAVCDFADALYPGMPATTSVDVADTGHDGVFLLNKEDVADYYAEYGPTVLRLRRDRDTMGLPAMNIGVSKGNTFDRVLLFPTGPMREYATSGDLAALGAPASLYVAATRARFSVAIVVD